MIDWSVACDRLRAADPILGTIIDRYPHERLEPKGDLFRTLANAIVGQQISVAAASAIWRRLETLVGIIEPARVAAASEDALRACGLSARKIEYLGALAQTCGQGELTSSILAGLADDQAAQTLCALRGIGPWTADMVLIFHGERPDILPLGDVGLLRSAARAFSWGDLDRAMVVERLAARAEAWRPFRTVAVWYLWRDLDPEPVAY